MRSATTYIAHGAAGTGAFLILVYLSPEMFGAPELPGVVWRMAQYLLVGAVWLASGRITFNWIPLRICWPWLVCLSVGITINYDNPDVLLVFLRTVFLFATVAACVGETSSSDSGRSVINTFFLVLLVGSAILSILIAITLLRSGWSWEQSRESKASNLTEGVLPYNITLFIYSIGLVICAPRGKLLNTINGICFAAISALLATRTPIVSLVASLLIVWFYYRVFGRTKGVTRSLVVWLVVVCCITIPLLTLWYLIANPDPDVARVLAGRLNLWQAAIEQWKSSPIFGNPGMTLKDALDASYPHMVFRENWEIDALYELGSGGFHSVWMQNLAFYGVIGLIGTTWTYVRILRYGMYDPRYFKYEVVAVLLFARSFTEYSGLLGYANAPLDFICTIALFYCATKGRSVSAAVSVEVGSQRSPLGHSRVESHLIARTY